MILDNIKNYLIEKEVAVEEEIKLNHDDSQNENVIVLWIYESIPIDMGSRPLIQVTVKNNDIGLAEEKCRVLYDVLYPPEQFAKQIVMDGMSVNVTPVYEPFFKEKEENGRYCFNFNIRVNTVR